MRDDNRSLYIPFVALIFGIAVQAHADEPIVFVRATLQYPDIVPTSSSVVNGVLPPRFDNSTGVQVQICDSDDGVLASYSRWDPRLAFREDDGPTQAPDGTQILFNARVIDGMRKILVMDSTDAMVLEEDLGPALVDGCQTGDIPLEVCATFDSDGDGCKDLEDDDPLVPEMQPPMLTVSVDPSLLWPPNHMLRTIAATVEVSDNCDDDPTVVLESVTSSEPDNLIGDGATAQDIHDADIGTLDLAFQLRAERTGKGPGRTYTIVYKATDRAGNMATQTAVVFVPRDVAGIIVPPGTGVVAPRTTLPEPDSSLQQLELN